MCRAAGRMGSTPFQPPACERRGVAQQGERGDSIAGGGPMHGAILIAACALSASPPSHADQAWEEACAHFEQAKAKLEDRAQAVPLFRRAAEKFAEAEAAGMRQPALYRNLGNAWYL